MVIFIRVNGKMIKGMDMVYIVMQMVIFMKVNGKIIKRMDMV
jgi:hypothetical protein